MPHCGICWFALKPGAGQKAHMRFVGRLLEEKRMEFYPLRKQILGQHLDQLTEDLPDVEDLLEAS